MMVDWASQSIRPSVVSGKIELEGEPLEEGHRVIVLVREEKESSELLPDLEAELLASIEEADSGALLEGSKVLRQIRS